MRKLFVNRVSGKENTAAGRRCGLFPGCRGDLWNLMKKTQKEYGFLLLFVRYCFIMVSNLSREALKVGRADRCFVR